MNTGYQLIKVEGMFRGLSKKKGGENHLPFFVLLKCINLKHDMINSKMRKNQTRKPTRTKKTLKISFMSINSPKSTIDVNFAFKTS